MLSLVPKNDLSTRRITKKRGGGVNTGLLPDLYVGDCFIIEVSDQSGSAFLQCYVLGGPLAAEIDIDPYMFHGGEEVI